MSLIDIAFILALVVFGVIRTRMIDAEYDKLSRDGEAALLRIDRAFDDLLEREGYMQ